MGDSKKTKKSDVAPGPGSGQGLNFNTLLEYLAGRLKMSPEQTSQVATGISPNAKKRQEEAQLNQQIFQALEGGGMERPKIVHSVANFQALHERRKRGEPLSEPDQAWYDAVQGMITRNAGGKVAKPIEAKANRDRAGSVYSVTPIVTPEELTRRRADISAARALSVQDAQQALIERRRALQAAQDAQNPFAGFYSNFPTRSQ